MIFVTHDRTFLENTTTRVIELSDAYPEGTFQADALPAAKAAPAEVAPDSTASATSDEISEHEFEALLDQLHGKGKFGGDVAAVQAPPAAKAPAAAKPQSPAAAKPAAAPAPAPVPAAASKPAAAARTAPGWP